MTAKFPLTPTLSPSRIGDRERWGWGEGGLGFIAGLDCARLAILPAARTDYDDSITQSIARCATSAWWQSTPGRSPALPRPMQAPHYGYSAWGEGRGEGFHNVMQRQLRVPLTPALSPSRIGDRERWGWGEGGLGLIAGLDSARLAILPAARTDYDDSITQPIPRCATSAWWQSTPGRSPALPRPMQASHSGYSAWGEGRGEG
jgi:hypothetical protein